MNGSTVVLKAQNKNVSCTCIIQLSIVRVINLWSYGPYIQKGIFTHISANCSLRILYFNFALWNSKLAIIISPLWLLIADIVLSELEKIRYLLCAFAYDFSFIYSVLRGLDLVLEAASALPIAFQLLECLHIQCSSNKSQALTFPIPF